jgi:hypothetical protein
MSYHPELPLPPHCALCDAIYFGNDDMCATADRFPAFLALDPGCLLNPTKLRPVLQAAEQRTPTLLLFPSAVLASLAHTFPGQRTKTIFRQPVKLPICDLPDRYKTKEWRNKPRSLPLPGKPVTEK